MRYRATIRASALLALVSMAVIPIAAEAQVPSPAPRLVDDSGFEPFRKPRFAFFLRGSATRYRVDYGQRLATTVVNSGGVVTTTSETRGPLNTRSVLPELEGIFRYTNDAGLIVTVDLLASIRSPTDSSGQLITGQREHAVAGAVGNAACPFGPGSCDIINNTQVVFDSKMSTRRFSVDTRREIGGGVAVGGGFHGSIWNFVGPDHGSFSQRQTSGTTPMPFDVSVTGDVSGRRSIEIQDFGANAITDIARSIGQGRWSGSISAYTTFSIMHTSFKEELTDLRFTNRTVVDNLTGASAPFPDGSGDDSELSAEGITFGWNFGVDWQGRTPLEGLYYTVGVGIEGSSFDHDPVEFDRSAFRPRLGLMFEF